ncbi:MAG: PAS domain S-box protein [Bacteroidales bacterium]|nr:PAS domain S-box protein [Bacteroidales bacterium]
MSPKDYRFQLGVLVVALSIFAMVAGVYYYRHERDVAISRSYNDLSAIANLKSNQIVQWRKERLSEAVFFSTNEPLVQSINRLAKGARLNLSPVKKPLQHLVADNRYENIFIVDTAGKLLISLDTTFAAADNATQQLSRSALHRREVIISDFYLCPLSSNIYFDIVAPVLNSRGAVAALLFFRVNPNSYLYPLIKNWPTPSATAETIIVRPDGDSILFINEVRHWKGTALRLRYPVTEQALPAVQATAGKTGLFIGVDYRGKTVIADLRSIPSTNWFMTTEVDLDEVLADVYSKAVIIAALLVVLVLFFGVFMALIYSYRQRSMYQLMLQSQQKLHLSQEEYKAILYSIGDGVITTNRSGLILQMNPVAEMLTGWLESEAKGMGLSSVFQIINEDTRKKVENPVSRVLREGVVVGLANHTLLISKDGHETPIADSGAPIKDERGNISGVVLIFRDQTDERLQHNLLRQSRNQFAHLFERAPLAYQSLNALGCVVEVNEAWISTLGYSRNEVVGKWFGDFLTHDFQEQFRHDYSLLQQTGDFHGKYRIAHKLGHLLYVEFNAKAIYSDTSSFETAHCMLQDVTVRTQMELALAESEEKHRALVTQMQLGLAVHKMIFDDKGNPIDYTFLDVNSAFEKLTGLKRSDILGKTVLEILPRTEKIWIEKYGQVALTGESITFESYAQEFDKYYGVLAYRSRENEFAVVVEDITDQKRLEQKLRDEQDRIRLLFNSTAEGIYGLDLNGSCTFCNMAAVTMLGFTSENELLGRNMHNLVHHSMHDGTAMPIEMCKIFKAFKAGERIHSNDEYFWRKSGESFPVEFWSYPLLKMGTVVGAVVTFLDITQRKQVEQMLVESKKRFKSLAESAPVGIFQTSALGETTYANQKYLEISGLSYTETMGYGWHKAVHPQDLALVTSNWKEEGTGPYGAQHEFRFVHSDGSITWVQGKVIAQFDEAGEITGYIGTVTDVTGQKRVEETLKSNYALLKIAGESARFGGWSINLDEGRVVWSDEVAAIHEMPLGYSPSVSEGINFYAPEWRTKIAEVYSKCAELGEPYDEELEIITARGNRVWVRVIGLAATTDQGKVTGIYGSFQDISKVKAAESSAEESSQALVRLMGNLSGVTYRSKFDENWTMEFISLGCVELTGYTDTEFYSNSITWNNLMDEQDRERIRLIVEQKLAQKEYFEVEYRLNHRNGHTLWLWEKGCGVYNAHGELLALEGFITDITDRVSAEQERFKLLKVLDNSFNEIYIFNADDFTFEYANQSAIANIGYSINELKRLRPVDIAPEISPQQFNNLLEPLTSGRELKVEFQTIHQRKDGSLYPIEVQLQLQYIGNSQIFYAIINDITQRKKAEETLRTSDKIFTHSVDMLAIAGYDGYLKVINPAWERTLGWTQQELLSKPWVQFVHPDDVEATENAKVNIIDGNEVYHFENRCLCKDGTYKWLSWRAFPYSQEQIMFSVARDITDSKAIESALRESETKFRSLIESAPVGIVISDVNQKTLFVNNKFVEFTGYTISDQPTVNEWWPMAYPDKDYRAQMEQLWDKAISQAIETNSSIVPIECRVTCKDKSVKYLEIGFVAEGAFNIVTFVDTTQRRLAEEELLALKNELEEKVKQKTQELQERVADLERFYDATVDRELRIKELRDELERLRGKGY